MSDREPDLNLNLQAASPKGLVAGRFGRVDDEVPIIQIISEDTPTTGTAHVRWLLVVEKEVRLRTFLMTSCL
jgi:hypothetical protein